LGETGSGRVIAGTCPLIKYGVRSILAELLGKVIEGFAGIMFSRILTAPRLFVAELDEDVLPNTTFSPTFVLLAVTGPLSFPQPASIVIVESVMIATINFMVFMSFPL
jgi:hypothetical protein